jgi:hypothetical protein
MLNYLFWPLLLYFEAWDLRYVPRVLILKSNNNTMYILCVHLHIHALKDTTICQMLSLYNMQHYVIYNYMFRPCKWTIIRLFVEHVSSLYHRSLEGGRDLVLHHILWGLYGCRPLYRCIAYHVESFGTHLKS